MNPRLVKERWVFLSLKSRYSPPNRRCWVARVCRGRLSDRLMMIPGDLSLDVEGVMLGLGMNFSRPPFEQL